MEWKKVIEKQHKKEFQKKVIKEFQKKDQKKAIEPSCSYFFLFYKGGDNLFPSLSRWLFVTNCRAFLGSSKPWQIVTVWVVLSKIEITISIAERSSDTDSIYDDIAIIKLPQIHQNIANRLQNQ